MYMEFFTVLVQNSSMVPTGRNSENVAGAFCINTRKMSEDQAEATLWTVVIYTKENVHSL